MLDKKVAKAYKKIVSAENDYVAFLLIDRLHPSLAKQVLLKYVMQQKQLERFREQQLEKGLDNR